MRVRGVSCPHCAPSSRSWGGQGPLSLAGAALSLWLGAVPRPLLGLVRGHSTDTVSGKVRDALFFLLLIVPCGGALLSCITPGAAAAQTPSRGTGKGRCGSCGAAAEPSLPFLAAGEIRSGIPSVHRAVVQLSQNSRGTVIAILKTLLQKD